MITLLVSGPVSAGAFERARKSCESLTRGAVILRRADSVLRVEIGADLAIELGGLLIALASLLLQMGRELRDRRTSRLWTADRLGAILQTEMLKHGVVDARVVDVVGFADLLSRQQIPCIVTLASGSQQLRIRVLVLPDGRTYLVDLVPTPIPPQVPR